MHDSDDLRQIKLLLFVGIVFLFSAYYSWREFKYLTFGKTADAQVTSAEIVEHRGRRGSRYEKLAVQFTFTDAAGASQSGRQELDPDAEVRAGDVVGIQYIAGDSYSPRLQGTGSCCLPAGGSGKWPARRTSRSAASGGERILHFKSEL
jgi:hypothetical protein